MVIGEPAKFAIESEITEAYERLGLRAIGFFVVHVRGVSYGVRAPDATALACSFDEVERRLAGQGKHIAPFAETVDAGAIAASIRRGVYGLDAENESFFGMSHEQFCNLVYANQIIWAPDGDEAFDDGSCILQFDVGDEVRLIAFRTDKTGGYDAATLSEARIPSREYYSLLCQWRDAFLAQWKAAPKSAS
jgi:hypothetical protein